MVYKDSLDEKKRHFHFGEFLHFQFGTNNQVALRVPGCPEGS